MNKQEEQLLLAKTAKLEKELEIEAALERVRVRTMAMHKSDELKEVAVLLYRELRSVGLTDFFNCGFVEVNEVKKYQRVWVTKPDGSPLGAHQLPLTGDKVLQERYRSWKKKQKVFSQVTDSKQLKNHIQFVSPHFGNQEVDEVVKSLPDTTIFYCGNFKYGYLHIITGTALNNEEESILARFAKVFEQTYTRFLDLQKAEAQAREAQIELGLERVRARAMAMQKSDELKELIGAVFTELTKLDLVLTRCNILIFDPNTNGSTWWMANSEAPSEPIGLFVKYHDQPPYLAYIVAWKERNIRWQYILEGKVKTDWDDVLFSETGLAQLPDFVIEGMKAPDKVYLNASFNNFGNLTLASLEPLSDEHFDIMLRFAKVFDMTYTRFLDLQKAEEQAREAQIEAALERVRSRTMGMQHSTELAQTALLMFEQIQTFGVDIWSCGFNIWNKEEKICTSWMSSKGILLPPMQIPLTENFAFIHFYESRMRGDSLFVDDISGEELEDHYRYMRTLPGIKEVMKIFANEKLTLPARQINHLANFSHGNLLFRTVEPCPQLHDIFKRFAKVFEQTYTRFLDLQKAEAQALEAIKQASLDRVRGEIASMRTKDDLNQITPLIWKELNTLGVPFIRCGVFIMNEEKRVIQTYLSTPNGQSLTAFEMAYDSEGVAAGAVFHWNKKEIYRDHWDKKQFVSFMQNLIKTGQIKNTESFQGTSAPPESLDLHFLPFKQGMLYVGNTSPLAREELQLVQSLADSFSIAYARYEDFKQLEEAKNQIENTLTELKSTQAQLIHAEKMASLGQLTAGIAHEIQNPLNFVNNFSELSIDLIDEMDEELANGNDKEVKAIKEDLKQNLEKINHHGNRASSIVKGMLQHSRSGSGKKQLTDINALADEYLRLSYHGLRAKDKSFKADFKTEFDETLPKIKVIPQDIGRVLLNLINNAFYAVSEARSSKPEAGSTDYKPVVIVSTKKSDSKIEIRVNDNGSGIPQNIVDKIFQPFFTTKPTGSGTGLGLSLSYDIIKAHGGEIKVESTEGEGTEFIIQIPIT